MTKYAVQRKGVMAGKVVYSELGAELTFCTEPKGAAEHIQPQTSAGRTERDRRAAHNVGGDGAVAVRNGHVWVLGRANHAPRCE